MTTTPALSLVVPVYNEVGLIQESSSVFRQFMESRNADFEIIYSDDGSSDGTPAELEKIRDADTTGKTRLVLSPENQGKGGALNLGLAEANGAIIAYIDADLEIPIEHLGQVFDGVESGFDMCVGSKYIGDSQREGRRKLAHLVYNGMVRTLLGSRVHDHSCGVKAFRNEVVKKTLPHMQDKKWVWDTEFLVRGQAEGYRVKEIPIHSIARRESKVKFVSAVIDSFGAVLKLWMRGVKVPRSLRKDATTARGTGS